MGVSQKHLFLEIHIALCCFLVLGPKETIIEKCALPKYVSFPLNWTPLPSIIITNGKSVKNEIWL